MNLSWKIGTIFKIPVRLHFTMALLPLLTFNWMPMDDATGIIVWAGVVILLFGSVLFHELGHALTARRYGIHTQDIVLTPIGGMARITSMPKNPRQEIIIAIAGPLVSLSLAGLTFASTILLTLVPAIPVRIYEGLGLLVWINLMLGLFNLVPALPMDGGRVLRGYLALKYDFLKATQIAAKVGRVLAVIGAVAGLFWLQSWSLVLISGFVYLTAGNEVRMAEWRAYQERMNRGGWNPFGSGASPVGGGTERGPFVRTWTWQTRRPGDETYGPSGRMHGERQSSSQDEVGSRQNEDWTIPDPVRRKDVVTITGGKAKVVSRKDPEDS